VLKISNVAFTFMENMLTVMLTPPHVAIADTQPLHIAFNAHGLGRYRMLASPVTLALGRPKKQHHSGHDHEH